MRLTRPCRPSFDVAGERRGDGQAAKQIAMVDIWRARLGSRDDALISESRAATRLSLCWGPQVRMSEARCDGILHSCKKVRRCAPMAIATLTVTFIFTLLEESRSMLRGPGR